MVVRVLVERNSDYVADLGRQPGLCVPGRNSAGGGLLVRERWGFRDGALKERERSRVHTSPPPGPFFEHSGI